MLSLIVAIAKNRVIGFEKKMPWHLPAELAYFKRVTMGHPIIMGRKTFESIGRPLPGRRNIVVSRDRTYAADGVEIVHSLDAAMAVCRTENAFIIGGATLYAEALPKVDRLYVTEIDASPEGDTFFPALDAREWKETSRERRERDEKNQFDVSFIVLDRIVQHAQAHR
jgi:dihydrofolate reductase